MEVNIFSRKVIDGGITFTKHTLFENVEIILEVFLQKLLHFFLQIKTPQYQFILIQKVYLK